MSGFFIGTAAWNIPKDHSTAFPGAGTHLQRYSQVLSAVEINSSFYRHHKPATYAKWAESTPEDFRFSVKLAKIFTHEQKLGVEDSELKMVLSGYAELGSKWGALLIQLPPSLGFSKTATEFFKKLRDLYHGPVVFEPRHTSWISDPALGVLKKYQISKVFADPEPCPLDLTKAPLGPLVYFRWHGSPEIYKSNYEAVALESLQEEMKSLSQRHEVWCIFDNTTFGHATLNALQLQSRLQAVTKSEETLGRTKRNPDHYTFS